MPVLAQAQQPILEFSVTPQPLLIAVGGRAVLSVEVENRSVYDADDIEAIWATGEGLGLAEEAEPIELIPPFESARLEAVLIADSTLEPGVVVASIDIIYSYCIGELCFQFAEPLQVEILVVEAGEAVDVAVLPADPTPVFPWRWAATGIGFLLLAGAGLLRRVGRASWLIVLLLIVVAVGALTYGVFERQHDQAQGIGAVLCTSCVGIEEARMEEPELSTAAIEEIESIRTDIELIVFYAPWCHACPFAEALVELIAQHNDRISFAFSNVEEEPEFADLHDVIRSRRTIVPAVLRVDTGEVVFGVEDLEERLLAMLRRDE